MTIQEFKALLLNIDPNVKHYKHSSTGNYTVWAEYNQNFMVADDKIHSGLLFVQVDRYTKTEYDPMVDAITAGLDVSHVFIRDRRTIYENDTGYIHHIWDLEVMQ